MSTPDMSEQLIKQGQVNASGGTDDGQLFQNMLDNITNKPVDSGDLKIPTTEERPQTLRSSQFSGAMRHSYRVSFAGEHGLTTFTGVLAILSTIIGGGIVSLPYAFVSIGVPFGIILNILAVILTIFSIDLYFAAKDIIPGKPESMYEIGYMVMDRPSIFLVGFIQFLNSCGLLLLYFITFGKTTGQLVANIWNDGSTDVFWCQKWFYSCILAALLMPVILKKELAELEWCSWVLFGSIFLFIVLNLWELTIDKQFHGEGLGLHDDIWMPDHGGSRTLNAVSVVMVAYSYQCNLFPIYTSLKEKTNAQYMKTNNYGLILTCCIYCAVALISVAMFGADTTSLVLDDIGLAVNDAGKSFWEGYVTQFSFIILLACHIPFIFFAGKEGVLVIIDELDRKSISSTLWLKLHATNEHFAKKNQDNLPPNPTLPIPGGDEKIMDFDSDQNVDAEQLRASRASAMASAKQRLSTMTTAEANRLAYKDMNQLYYVIGTLTFYLVVLGLAILLDNISIVLDISAAFAISALAFVFPSIFYFKGKQRFGGSIVFYERMACLYLCLGVFNCCLSLTSCIWGIITGDVGGE